MPPAVDIASVITKAHVADWRAKSHSVLMSHAELPHDVERFLSAMESANMDCLLVGGLALLTYVSGRNTEDIDLIAKLSDLKAIEGIVVDEENAKSARAHFGQLEVDVLRASDPFFAHIAEKFSNEGEFVGHQMQVASPQGLALLKLYALPSLYRQGNLDRVGLYENDIRSLLNHRLIDESQLIPQLHDFMENHDLKELSKILAELRPNPGRFS